MITDEERARAAARTQARLDQLPDTPEPEHVGRIATLLTTVRLRIARDRARQKTPASHQPPGRHRVTPKEPPGDHRRNHQAEAANGTSPSGAGDRV